MLAYHLQHTVSTDRHVASDILVRLSGHRIFLPTLWHGPGFPLASVRINEDDFQAENYSLTNIYRVRIM